MNTRIKDIRKSERSVEVLYTNRFIREYLANLPFGAKVLEVGGITTDYRDKDFINVELFNRGINHEICDFRGGKYKGDFVTYDFGDKKFSAIMFVSTIEHFPQCTEGDKIYRAGEDRKGFLKALSLLDEGGLIFVTVPFGKHKWQPYHQNYNWDGIMKLTEGASMVEFGTYKLEGDEWVKTDPHEMEDVEYTGRAYGVGCFVLQK